MSNTFRVRLTGLDAAFAGPMHRLQASARPSAQAGAQVLHDVARRQAPRSSGAHRFIGTQYAKNGTAYTFQPGTLQAAIYQAFSRDNSADGQATYHVTVNTRKAPYWFWAENGRVQRHAVVLTKAGRFMTLKHQPLAAPKRTLGKPYLGAARDALPQAEAAMRQRFSQEMQS